MISTKQKNKLRLLLEKISTPEEMKAFDMEILSETNDKSKKDIIETIKNSKTEIDYQIVQNLIEKSEKLIEEKLDGLKNDFNDKKYPVFDDSKINDNIKKIQDSLNENGVVKGIESKTKKEMVSELVRISDILLKTQEIIDTKPSNNAGVEKTNEYLEGVISVLGKILQSTGSNDSVRLRDSGNTIINPASEDTLQFIAGEKANVLAIVGNYIYEGNAAPGSATSSSVWQVSRFDKVNLVTVWADGNTSSDNIWDNYASLTYL